METIEIMKNKLVDRILSTNNEKLLLAVKSIFDLESNKQVLKLSTEQIEMLWMSEKNIESGEVVSEFELDRMDEEWLK